MMVDTNTNFLSAVDIQNFSKVESLEEDSAVAKDEDVLEISKRLLVQNKEAYEVLAK